ncbi:MAG: hypothetical protein OXI53_08995 [Nitrospira sp.]|nr:hypothetical protein [Nitrospira sp.]MDE0503466.1 hypothetical protein [Candidatus Poribacteria bacterium]
MSQTKTLLDLELRLLIAQHGKPRVSKALSAIGEVDLSEIGVEIKTYEEKAKRKDTQRRSRKSIEEMVQDANPDSFDAKHLIEQLARRYEKKEFLPELREVKRFLESRRVPIAKFRSRAEALPMVLSLLAQFTLDDLQALDEKGRYRGSDLGIITDQILGRGNGT